MSWYIMSTQPSSEMAACKGVTDEEHTDAHVFGADGQLPMHAGTASGSGAVTCAPWKSDTAAHGSESKDVMPIFGLE